jgi:hypothetical protein
MLSCPAKAGHPVIANAKCNPKASAYWIIRLGG